MIVLLMFLMSSFIEVGNYYFDYVHSVETESTWKNFTDTAKVQFPRVLQNDGKPQKLDEVIKRGDIAKVQLGYDNVLHEVINGYVGNVKPTIPVEIGLEDKMFALKVRSVEPKEFKNVSLSEVLKYIGLQPNEYKMLGETTIDKFTIEPDLKNCAQVLERWKRETGQPAFYRNGILVIGKPYDPETANTEIFAFGYNIIEHDLEYRKRDEVRLRIKAISNQKDGKKMEVIIGDPDGEERTLNFYNIGEKQLKIQAEIEMERLKYDGWRGKFTAFGEPFVQHGDIANLIDTDNGEKDGSFYIDSVKRSYDSGGYRQVIELGVKA